MPNASNYSGSALLCSSSESPSKQTKTEQKKSTYIHVRNRFSAKKASPLERDFVFKSPEMEKIEMSECEIVKCGTTYPVLRDTLDSPAESVPLNRMSCILHLKYTKISRTEINLSPSNNIGPETLVTVRLVAHAVTWSMLWASLCKLKCLVASEGNTTLHLITIWHLKRTIQHGMQLLSAQINKQKGLDDVLLSQGWCPVLRRTVCYNVFWLTVFVSTAQSNHARSKLQLVMWTVRHKALMECKRKTGRAAFS